MHKVQLVLNQDTTDCVIAERAYMKRLNGGCQVPLAGHAIVDGDKMDMSVILASVNGDVILQASKKVNRKENVLLGTQLAEELLAAGGHDILRSVGIEVD